jgi:hypothetical protein
MNTEVTKKEIVVFLIIVAVMVGSLVYGFFLMKAGQQDNCWDNYTTEEQAILHCEDHS